MKKFNAIMKSYHKTIDELDALVQTLAHRKDVKLEKIDKLTQDKILIDQETKAAGNMAAKMKELFKE